MVNIYINYFNELTRKKYSIIRSPQYLNNLARDIEYFCNKPEDISGNGLQHF